MKRLTSITATNFKGLSFTTPLSPATILVGQNFAGKTARTDAIRLLLLGHLPELGATNKATMGLASGREMAVSGTFEDGATMSRNYRMKGDSVACEKDVPPAVEACEQLAVMLNAEAYFALGDRARVEYVAANCPSEGMMNPNQIIARISEKTKATWPKLPEDKVTVQQFVEKMIEQFTEQSKTARAYAGKMEGTVQGLAALRAGDDQTKIAAGLTALDAKRNELNAEVTGLNERRATLKADQDQRDKVAMRHEVIAREFALVDVDGKRTKLDELKNVFAKLVLPDEPSKEKATKMRTEENRLNGNLATARADYRTAESLRAMNAKELIDMDGITACPYCGATGEGWKELKRTELSESTRKLSAQLAEFAECGRKIKEQLDAVKKDIEFEEQSAAALQTIIAEQNRLRREISELEVTLSRMNAMAEERANLPPAVAADPTEMVAVGHKISQMQSELNDIETHRRAAMGRHHELGRLAQAEEERDKAKAEAEAAKAAADELRVIQGEMVEAAFKPLLERANRIFGSVLKSPLAYRDGEIGTWRDGLFVGHRTMSGTEKTLVYASIQAALTSARTVRIMLIDELGRLDTDNKRKVGKAAIEAVERGDIDQFIGIDAEQKQPGKEIAAWARETGLTVVEIRAQSAA